MTQEFTEFIAAAIRATYPWIDELQFIGRLSKDGYVIGQSNYMGLDDRRGQYGYFRYRGENDHSYEEAKKVVSKGKWFKVTTEQRLIMVVDLSQCDSLQTLESQIVSVLATIQMPQSNSRVKVVRSSTDFEKIYSEETGGANPTWADYLKLISIDFDLEYYSSECCEVVYPSGDCDCESVVTNYLDEVIATLDCNEDFEVPASIARINGVDHLLVPGEEYVHNDECADARYENSDGSYVVDIPSGSPFVSDPINVTQVDGSITPSPANIPVSCAWSEISIENTIGDGLLSLTSYPFGGVGVVPNQLVEQRASDAFLIASQTVPVGEGVDTPDINVTDGVFTTDLPARSKIVLFGSDIVSAVINGDEIEVTVDGGVVPTLTPNYQIPQLPKVGFYDGDLLDLFTEGYYDRCFVSNQYKYVLDQTDNYFLDASTPNPWGNLDRFVFDDGTGAWNGIIFVSSPVRATEGIIIDVWSGLMIYRRNLGSLAGFSGAGFTYPYEYALSLAKNFTVGAYNGFRALSKVEILSIIPDPTQVYYATTNLLLRGSGNTPVFNETQFYLSETDNAGTNAFVLTASGDITRRARTTTSLISVYAVANWN